MRKTAAVCVAKLYDINAELVEDRGFLDMLKVGRAGGRLCGMDGRVGWIGVATGQHGAVVAAIDGMPTVGRIGYAEQHERHPTLYLMKCLFKPPCAAPAPPAAGPDR